MDSRGLRFNWATAVSLVIVVTFLLALWQRSRFDLRAGLFPWVIGFPVLVLSVIQLMRDLLGKDQKKSAADPEAAGHEVPDALVIRRTAAIAGWIIGYFVSIWLLGFSTGGALCTFAHLKLGSREKWPITIILTLLSWAVIYGVFYRVLHVPFPTGRLFIWLNLAT